MRTRSFILGFALAAAACGRSAPAPPTIAPPSGGETITGTERLGWDQRAADQVELATIRYAIYVDGSRSELSGVSCASASSAAGFACTARLPALTTGSHTLELASFVQDGTLLESSRSPALRVTVAGSASTTAADAPAWPDAAARVATSLVAPSDLAVLPDGRVLVAERAGRVRILRADVLSAEPATTLQSLDANAMQLLALAVDPDFDRTRFVFALHTERTPAGGLSFVVARFTAVGDTLGDRVTVLDHVAASSDPHGSLRFGPDGKLYVALDDGGQPRNAGDAGSFNGKVLRLNRDGTTPADQPRHSPVVAAGYTSPRGIAWSAAGEMIVADEQSVGAVRWTSAPLALASRGADLLVASERGLRTIRPGRQGIAPAGSADALVENVPVRAVAVAGDGRIYFATDTAVGVVGK